MRIMNKYLQISSSIILIVLVIYMLVCMGHLSIVNTNMINKMATLEIRLSKHEEAISNKIIQVANRNENSINPDAMNRLSKRMNQLRDMLRASNLQTNSLIQAASKPIVGLLNQIQKKLNHKPRPKPKTTKLPFSVMHIDVVHHYKLISIKFGQRIMAMEVGDSLAGWKLIKADYRHKKTHWLNKKTHGKLVVIAND